MGEYQIQPVLKPQLVVNCLDFIFYEVWYSVQANFNFCHRHIKTNKTLVLVSITIQYITIQYNTMQCNAIQYNTIQYNTIQSKKAGKISGG